MEKGSPVYRPRRDRRLLGVVRRGEVVCVRRLVMLLSDFPFPGTGFFGAADPVAFVSRNFFPWSVLGGKGAFAEGLAEVLVATGEDFSVCLGASGRLGRKPPAPSL